MRIILIGTVEFSKMILETLIHLKKDVVAVISKEKSSYNSDFADLSQVCTTYNLDYKHVKDINSIEVISYIKQKDPDVIFCVGWSQIIKKELLIIPKLGVIGYHPTLLPQNRGRHPLIWALALGLEETGSTFFFMDEGADSGDILSQEKIKIDYKDNARSLYNKITLAALDQIQKILPLLEANTFTRMKQDHLKANSWRKREEKDGEIDWRMSSKSIYNLVRALTRPYIGAHFIYKGEKIKVWSVEERFNIGFCNFEPGKIVEVYPDKSFLVKTGENLIRVLECNLDKIPVIGEYL